jgi:hypothetical protein
VAPVWFRGVAPDLDEIPDVDVVWDVPDARDA